MNLELKTDSLIPQLLLRECVTEKYNLQVVSLILLINNLSEIYLLKSIEDDYIFKIYRDEHFNWNEVTGEIELLNILKENSISVSYPITDLKGDQVQVFQSSGALRYGILYTYAPGEVSFEMTEKQIASVGLELAKMHNITEGLELQHNRKELNLNNLLYDPIRIIEPAFSELKDEYRYLQTMSASVGRQMENFDYSKMSYGYCHYDIHPHNFHFQPDGKVTFFDFELAGKGYFINDLLSFYAHYSLLMMYGRTTQLEASRAFYVLTKNYRTIRPISDNEIATLPYFGFASWIFHLAFDYSHFTDRSSVSDLREQFGFIRKWVDWYMAP